MEQHDHNSMGDTQQMTSAGEEMSSFCDGDMAMVMYMDGFHWSLKEEGSCINLYLASWTLDTRWKFLIGMLGVVLLGVATEGIARLRHDLAMKARTSASEEHLKYTLYQTGLHGLHALSGYMLMLATMTFSCELMLSVILGLIIGFNRFGRATLSITTPCCAFLDYGSDSPANFTPASAPTTEAALPRGNVEGSLRLIDRSCSTGGCDAGDQGSNSNMGSSDVAQLSKLG
jgi:Ctr copper transporter family